MKRVFIWLGGAIVVAGLSGWGLAAWQDLARRKQAVTTSEERLAAEAWVRQLGALVASADRVVIAAETAQPGEGVEVRDAKWIRHFGAVLATVPVGRRSACLCAGWRTATFYAGTKRLGSIAAIHGNQLRISLPEHGGDYSTDAAHWAAVDTALEMFDVPGLVPVLPHVPGSMVPKGC